MSSPRKLENICVCTSVPAHAEPRAPRHASLLAEVFPDATVTFVDFQIDPGNRIPTPVLRDLPNLKWVSLPLPTKDSNPLGRLAGRIGQRAAECLFAATDWVRPSLLFSEAAPLSRTLGRLQSDLYFAHNIETLLPAFRASRLSGGHLAFDCMEYYSDMGDGQSAIRGRAIRRIESECLPAAEFVTASSPEMADAYASRYQLARVLPLYNCPLSAPELSPSPAPTDTIRLYWRNAVIGFGQRGLGLALDALKSVPENVILHLQGRLPADGGKELLAEIDRRGLGDRVVVEPPHPPDGAVTAAARFHIGLCLEEDCNENHRLTVSNKIFDYLMAGQAVIASALPALSEVIRQSGGGLGFSAGSSDSLAAAINRLVSEVDMLASLRAKAREFALRVGNREHQNRILAEHLRTWFPTA